MPAATPSSAINAGVHDGQIATAKGTPSKKAPQAPDTRLTRKAGALTRRRIHPGQTRPIRMSQGPSTSPQ